MQKLPRLSGKEVIKALSKVGFSVARQKGKNAVAVPNHKEIDKGTLLEIIRQASLTKEDFLKLL